MLFYYIMVNGYYLKINLSNVVETQNNRCNAIPRRKKPKSVYPKDHPNSFDKNHAPIMVMIQSAMAIPNTCLCMPSPGIPKAFLY